MGSARLVCACVAAVFVGGLFAPSFLCAAFMPAPSPAPDYQSMVKDMAAWAKTQKSDAGWICGTIFLLSDEGKKYQGVRAPQPFALSGGVDPPGYVMSFSHVVVDVSGATPMPGPAAIEAFGNDFDNRIYPATIAAFGDPNVPVCNVHVSYIDGPLGTGGFFNVGTIDITIDSADFIDNGGTTMAHEFQHLIHDKVNNGNELWANEACSVGAEFLTFPQASTVRARGINYAQQPDAPLGTWGGSLQDYGRGGIWVYYLVERVGTWDLTQYYNTNRLTGISGFGTALSHFGFDLNTIFQDWIMANSINDPTILGGVYGYKNYSFYAALEGTHDINWQGGGSVNEWAASDHLVQTSEMVDVKVTFTGTGGAYGMVAPLGRAYFPSTVMKIGGSGTVNVYGVNVNYSKIELVVAGVGGGGTYNWSLSSTPSNRPPMDPQKPTGETALTAGTDYTFSTSTTDPEGDELVFTFNWGDGTTTNSTGYTPSGGTASASHKYAMNGQYQVRAMATDRKLARSMWSSALIVEVSGGVSDDTPPDITNCLPSGTVITGTPAISAEYSDSSGVDPASVVVQVDGTVVTNLSTVTASSFSYMPTFSLTDGTHSVHLEVSDSSPGKNLATKDWSFIVDFEAAKKPSAPLNLAATATGQNISLVWSAPASQGLSPITNYIIYRGTSSGGESQLAEIGSLLAYDDKMLPSGVYYYKVAAKNSNGTGLLSNEAYATAQAPITAPDAPQSLVATATGTTITLAWGAPASDGGTPITNYEIYRGATSTALTFLKEVGDILTTDDAGLSWDTAYYYAVAAKNSKGEGAKSAVASATTPAKGVPPAVPVGLAASAGDKKVQLSWSPVSGATGYNVYRTTTSGSGYSKINLAAITAMSYEDRTVTNGQTYYYAVTAVNANGESNKSAEQSAKPVGNTNVNPPASDGQITQKQLMYIVIAVVIFVVLIICAAALSRRKKEPPKTFHNVSGAYPAPGAYAPGAAPPPPYMGQPSPPPGPMCRNCGAPSGAGSGQCQFCGAML